MIVPLLYKYIHSDLLISDEESSEEDVTKLQYQPVLDLNRFQKFLQIQQDQNQKDDHSTKMTNSMAHKVLKDMEKLAEKTKRQQNKGKMLVLK